MEFFRDSLLQQLRQWVMTAGAKLLLALVLLFVSFRVIERIARRVLLRAQQKKIDKTVVEPFVYVTKLLLRIGIALSLIRYVGVDTGGLAALLASLGVGLGVALNGTLGNVAGGVLLLITRPFGIDNFIEVGEYAGTVEEIRLVHTRVRTPDNRVIYIPNGIAATACVVNHSEKTLRRLDVVCRVSEQADFRRAEQTLLSVCASRRGILPAPAPTARITAYTESGIEISLRAWVRQEEYWDMRFDLLEAVKTALDREGIAFSYHRLDVRLAPDPQRERMPDPSRARGAGQREKNAE